ncbi:hypothetical protein GALL_543010 [mine drainage metagenome]|uniref:Uncharacterized protein n=1 Tax=mine drainage metagenome TaxID=410659 RepID=A0A1J5PKT9_9ZZZZ
MSNLTPKHGVVTNKTGYKTVGRGFIKLRDNINLLNRTVVEHGDPIRHGEGFSLVMRDIDKSQSQFAVQLLEFELHVFAQLFVQRAQGLIHQYQLRVKYQGPCQRHALLLATRELPGKTCA